MTCYMCRYSQPSTIKECRMCGSKAFYHGKRSPGLCDPLQEQKSRKRNKHTSVISDKVKRRRALDKVSPYDGTV